MKIVFRCANQFLKDEAKDAYNKTLGHISFLVFCECFLIYPDILTAVVPDNILGAVWLEDAS